MEKTFAVCLTILLFFTFFTTPVHSQSASTAASVQPTQTPFVRDNRVKILEEYLKIHNSPMVSSAATFVQAADENELDWKLVAAISGVESTFGHHIPHNSYNAWGWGVYGDNVIRFASFDEGITTISQGLRKNYFDKGAKDVFQVGRIYAASPTWATKVTYFLGKIEEFAQKNASQSLPLTI